ncbi:NAD(P)-dependent alcohol dehydrogenase [Arthrobacter bambusae]|uniref:NAD(P)-dependent alcohol dehydrogenase n=1 Tax=Arthrobacter bambusae TaxID=1338426 RepID=UPI001F50455A|nr:NAD(P)-dependent alcohol dehydrogenase [Arthrobacter bambusae]MCI0143012.1 NAD(P)-dependent alcohol dehydrogenase [Arthrobacter bambusae]
MAMVNARIADAPGARFTSTTIERREVGPHDVLIDILFCGICHSDVSHARSEWGHNQFPIVPGHEIAGVVSAVGEEVTKFSVGDRAGVGCLVDSCRECRNCRLGHEEQCLNGNTKTYGTRLPDGSSTYGGYSEKIVVNEDFVLRLPENLPLERIAPLLCAGATVYSPMVRWGAGPGRRVGILGFGGLGHVAVQISKALGAHTTVFDLSLDKKDDGIALGADEYYAVTDPKAFAELGQSLDLIISTVPANVDLDAYLGLLMLDGVFVSIGVPSKALSLDAFSIIVNRRALAGSRIASIQETQQMLDFCSEHEIGAVVEVIDASRLDEAYDRLVAGDVKFRFVLDTASMANG